MTVQNPIDFASEWSILGPDEFVHRATGRTFTRQDWEIEISFQYQDDVVALNAAKEFARS